MNQITFDIAPGVHENIPEQRLTRMRVSDERLMDVLGALHILDKNVLSIDIVDEN